MSPLLSLSLLFFVSCGLGAQESLQNERIINGVPAGPTEFPFQLSLQTYRSDVDTASKGFFHNCGATIISKHYALTAAHCLYCEGTGGQKRCNPSELRLLAGSITLNPISQDYSYHHVESYVNYPSYEHNSAPVDDIAIIRVKTPFDLSLLSKLKAVRLEKDSRSPLANISHASPSPGLETHGGYSVNNEFFAWNISGSVTVVGWGKTEIDRYSQRLRKEDVPVMPHEVCERAFAYIANYIRGSMICAKGRNSSVCAGDSGGPMIQNGTQIGVTSFVTNNKVCPVNQPFVYMRVGRYYSWIRINTNYEV